MSVKNKGNELGYICPNCKTDNWEVILYNDFHSATRCVTCWIGIGFCKHIKQSKRRGMNKRDKRTLKTVATAQLRRAEMTIEEKRLKRMVLRSHTGCPSRNR